MLGGQLIRGGDGGALCAYWAAKKNKVNIPWAIFYPQQTDAHLESAYRSYCKNRLPYVPQVPSEPDTGMAPGLIFASQAEIDAYLLDLSAKYLEEISPTPEKVGGIPWRAFLLDSARNKDYIASTQQAALQHYKIATPLLILPSVAVPTEATTRVEENNMPDVPAPKNPHIPTISTLKGEMKSAAYLIAADKVTRLAVVGIGSALQRGLPNESEEFRAKLGAFAETEVGQVMIALILSGLIGPLGGTLAAKLGMTGAQLDQLSTALRIHGMVHGGSAMLDRFFEPALLVLKDVLRDLPEGLPAEELRLHEKVRDRGELEAVRERNEQPVSTPIGVKVGAS